MPNNNAKLRQLLKAEYLLLAGILILTLAMRLTFLHEPFERDEGVYAYLGQELLRGSILYKEAMELKPPGVMVIYALMIGLFSLETSEGIRILTALYVLGTVISVYWFARYLRGVTGGLCAALFYAVFSSGPVIQGSSSNSETFLVLPLTLSAYFFVRWIDSEKRSYLVAAGGLAACATLIKTVTLPFILLCLCVLLWRGVRLIRGAERKIPALRCSCLEFAAFAAMPVLLYTAIGIYFVWHHAIGDALYWNYDVLKVYGKTPLPIFMLIMKRGVLEVYREHLFLYLLAVPTALWLLFAERRVHSIYIAMLLPAAFFGLAMPGKFFPHYFIQLIPFLAILAGVGAAELIARPRVLLYATAPVLIYGLALWLYVDYPYYFRYSPDEVCMKKYETSGIDFVNAVAVARFLKERSKPGDYTYQWHYEPQIYFLSGLRAPNPYFDSYMTTELTKDPGFALMEVDRTLREKKPRFIVASERSMYGYGWQVVSKVIVDNYKFSEKIGNYMIFRNVGA